MSKKDCKKNPWKELLKWFDNDPTLKSILARSFTKAVSDLDILRCLSDADEEERRLFDLGKRMLRRYLVEMKTSDLKHLCECYTEDLMQKFEMLNKEMHKKKNRQIEDLSESLVSDPKKILSVPYSHSLFKS